MRILKLSRQTREHIEDFLSQYRGELSPSDIAEIKSKVADQDSFLRRLRNKFNSIFVLGDYEEELVEDARAIASDIQFFDTLKMQDSKMKKVSGSSIGSMLRDVIRLCSGLHPEQNIRSIDRVLSEIVPYVRYAERHGGALTESDTREMVKLFSAKKWDELSNFCQRCLVKADGEKLKSEGADMHKAIPPASDFFTQEKPAKKTPWRSMVSVFDQISAAVRYQNSNKVKELTQELVRYDVIKPAIKQRIDGAAKSGDWAGAQRMIDRANIDYSMLTRGEQPGDVQKGSPHDIFGPLERIISNAQRPNMGSDRCNDAIGDLEYAAVRTSDYLEQANIERMRVMVGDEDWAELVTYATQLLNQLRRVKMPDYSQMQRELTNLMNAAYDQSRDTPRLMADFRRKYSAVPGEVGKLVSRLPRQMDDDFGTEIVESLQQPFNDIARALRSAKGESTMDVKKASISWEPGQKNAFGMTYKGVANTNNPHGEGNIKWVCMLIPQNGGKKYSGKVEGYLSSGRPYPWVNSSADFPASQLDSAKTWCASAIQRLMSDEKLFERARNADIELAEGSGDVQKAQEVPLDFYKLKRGQRVIHKATKAEMRLEYYDMTMRQWHFDGRPTDKRIGQSGEIVLERSNLSDFVKAA